MRSTKLISNVTVLGSASDSGLCSRWARQLRASAPAGRSAAHHRNRGGPPQPGLGPDSGLPQTRPVALDEVRQGQSVRGEHLGDFLDGAHVGDVVAVKVDAQVFAWLVTATSEAHARDPPRTTDQLHPLECAPTRQTRVMSRRTDGLSWGGMLARRELALLSAAPRREPGAASCRGPAEF